MRAVRLAAQAEKRPSQLALRNGNILAFGGSVSPLWIREITAKGRVVWETFAEHASPDALGRISFGVLGLGFNCPRPADLDVTAVPFRMKSLSHREWKIREHAADELAELGPKAAAAVPALARLLADPHKPVRIAACMALNRIGPAAYPAALAAARDQRKYVRRRGLALLGRYREKAKEIAPVLIDALQNDADVMARRSAVTSLADLGPDCPGASRPLPRRSMTRTGLTTEANGALLKRRPGS